MRTFAITDVGMVRQVNQDYVFATDRPLGILQNLFVVADGMGGHQAGDYASKYTVEVLQRELKMSEGEDVDVDKVVDAANEALKMFNTVKSSTVFSNLDLNGVIDELMSSLNSPEPDEGETGEGTIEGEETV